MSGFNTNLEETNSFVIDGNPAQIYPLSVHVRAAVELMEYDGGEADGHFLVGGSPRLNKPNTVVKLEVSQPAQTYYLNRALVATNYSIALDYYANIEASGGATLTLKLIRKDHVLYKEDAGGGVVDTEIASIDGEYVQIDFVNTLEGDVVEERAGVGSCRRLLFSGYAEDIIGGKAEQ